MSSGRAGGRGPVELDVEIMLTSTAFAGAAEFTQRISCVRRGWVSTVIVVVVISSFSFV
jgi:hypothetical protein